MKVWDIKVRAYWRLGARNLWRVGLYRFLRRVGWYRLTMPVHAPLTGPVIDWSKATTAISIPDGIDSAEWVCRADRVIGGELPVFAHSWRNVGFPPCWNRNFVSGIEYPTNLSHWSSISDFGLAGGDIKGWWEASRFEGLLFLVIGWLCTRRQDFRDGVEAWWESWNDANPANAGLQWKCGQEVSIRLMHGLLAIALLKRWGGVTPTRNFDHWVMQHCQRILCTMGYAIGQDNNHGTSEAAALFVAGQFLSGRGGERWALVGRRRLEERVRKLVADDGSFSQHSTNYHRVFLDTVSFVETWRRQSNDKAFSDEFYRRCGLAAEWLEAFTDIVSGDAPNLGANDGARLFPILLEGYRDFRPSQRWANLLFTNRAPTHFDERLAWLGLTNEDVRFTPNDDIKDSKLLPHGGYVLLAVPRAWLLFRLPRYSFRPSNADSLHVDFWLNGVNQLRDGGTFSYNTDKTLMEYFSGTESHNTIQFDGRDQMPRVSRFLFGEWLEIAHLKFDLQQNSCAASYHDSKGVRHTRKVTLGNQSCVVVDDVSNFNNNAIIRWRLAPEAGPWHCENSGCHGRNVTLFITATAPFKRFEIVDGWESRHYNHKTRIPVLEVEFNEFVKITTNIVWQI